MIAAILSAVGVFFLGLYIGHGEGRRKTFMEQESIIESQQQYIAELQSSMKGAFFNERDCN